MSLFGISATDLQGNLITQKKKKTASDSRHFKYQYVDLLTERGIRVLEGQLPPHFRNNILRLSQSTEF